MWDSLHKRAQNMRRTLATVWGSHVNEGLSIWQLHNLCARRAYLKHNTPLLIFSVLRAAAAHICQQGPVHPAPRTSALPLAAMMQILTLSLLPESLADQGVPEAFARILKGQSCILQYRLGTIFSCLGIHLPAMRPFPVVCLILQRGEGEWLTKAACSL